MKKGLVLLLCAGFLFLSAAADRGKRIVEVGGKTEKVAPVEIVVEKMTPLLKFTSNELQGFLSKATGAPVPVVSKPSDKAFSLILGDNSFSRQTGLNVASLPSEGYYIKRVGNRVYLAGLDSETSSPEQNSWLQCYPRGTLSAAYDFLERFAGVRFFFPGESGTVVPKKGGLFLPEKINILERPDFIDRRFYSGSPRWYEKDGYNGVKGANLNLVRLRFSENNIPFGHGLAHLDYIGRFSKTHPEYFALFPDGRRYCEPDMVHTGHLCFNSGIREEIYQDVKAYLTGRPASERGMKSWNFNAARPGYFSLMTQDWLYWCGCDKCKKIAEPGRGRVYKEDSQNASDFMWKFTAEIANRLTRDGIKGAVTQMAYSPYDKIPKCDLPENVTVQVACSGPGSKEDDREKIAAWSKKAHGNLSVWTYTMGKHMSKILPGVPAMMPRYAGNYYQDRKQWIIGGFTESETDEYLFNYLNYYILSKAMWDTSADVNALLDDHFRAMFGSGAVPMRKFFDILEDNWVNRILGNTVQTGLGPVTKVPNEREIWTRIYSPEAFRQFDKLFDSAEAMTAREPEAQARIRFIRKGILEPIRNEAKKYQRRQAAVDSWSVNVPGSVWLRPVEGESCDVRTQVTISRADGKFLFTFDCEEPRMSEIALNGKSNDDPRLFEDSCVELFLNPSGDRKNYFHFIATPAGVFSDYKAKLNEKPDLNWNSGASVTAEKLADSWKVTIAVPEKALGDFLQKGFPVNFARHRAMTKNPPKIADYQWSPVPRKSFHELEQFGMMNLTAPEKANLIRESDFQVERKNLYSAGKLWRIWGNKIKTPEQRFEFDKSVFINGGQSFHIINPRGGLGNCSQVLENLKPDTKYRLSYFLKTRLTPPGGAGAYLVFCDGSANQLALPRPAVSGDNPWHRLAFEFKTPSATNRADQKQKPLVAFWVWNAEGEAWFDDVRIEEVTP